MLRSLPSQRIDFAAPRSRVPLLSWLLLIVGLAVAAGGFLSYMQARDAKEQLQQDELQDERARYAVRRTLDEAGLRRLKQDWGAAENLSRQLNIPWENVFSAVERTATDDVVLTALKPDPHTNRVAITGEAKSFIALLSFVARMEVTPPFNGAYLTSHEYVEGGAAYKLRFNAIAEWNKP